MDGVRHEGRLARGAARPGLFSRAPDLPIFTWEWLIVFPGL